MRLRRGKSREDDLERELRSHLELEAEEEREGGLSADDARYAARRALGNTALIKEDVRSAWGWTSIERIGSDLRYALRTARRNPGFAATIVLILALGIGLNTAVFSMVRTVLLRKPPYAEPDRLVNLSQKFPKVGDVSMGACPAEFLDYRDRNRAFSSVAGYEDEVFDLTGGDEPVHVSALQVTHNLFATLGVRPLAGRTFLPAEDAPGGAKVAILSHALWRRLFGGSATALGAVIRLNEQPYTVIGIMPAGFEFPLTAASVGEPPALWVPIAFTAESINDRAAEFPVRIVARLRPGVSVAQARQDARRVADEFQREHADIYSGNVRLEVNLEVQGDAEAARARPVLFALAGAVTFVLLIACANVVNLLSARAETRRRAWAVRKALGAGAGRLAAQLLTEGLLLAGCGAVLGCVLAEAVIRLVAANWPSFVAGLAEARIDPMVLAYTLTVSVVTGVACALLPALERSRPDLGAALKQAGRLATGPERRRVRGTLVIFEAASAVTLLIGAALLVHSLVEVLRVPMGFSPGGVVIARTSLNDRRYPSGAARSEAERRMIRRLATLPGVTAVGLTTHIPLADERKIGFVLEGQDVESVLWADSALVSGDYFGSMGIPLLRGRTFGGEDTPQGPLSAIVNESTARRFWPAGDALGKRIVWGGKKLTVVGIVGDVHINALDTDLAPTIYMSVFQANRGVMANAVFIVRTGASEPARFAQAVREAIWSVDRGVPVYETRTMDQIVARSLTARRFAAALVSAFAVLALVLAVLGLYGVLSYSVAQRTSELGLRFALGATPANVLRLVLGEGLRLTVAGVAIGALVGAAAARTMSHLLFRVQTFDPAAFAVAALTLPAVAAIASFLPALRAARVDPMAALRNE